MTTPAESSVPTKVLSIGHTSFVFSIIFFLFSLMIAITRVCSEGVKIFLIFMIIYPKINMNVVKTISPRQ